MKYARFFEEKKRVEGGSFTESTPIIRIQSTLQDQQLRSPVRISIVVHETKQENGEDASQAADHKVEPPPPVAPLAQSDDEYRHYRRTYQIADQENLQDIRALERHDDDRDDQQDNQQPDHPDVELVAEQVVGAGRNQRRLEGVERRRGQRHGHHEDDADNPCGELSEQQEESEIAIFFVVERPGTTPGSEQTGYTDEGKNDEHDAASERDADPEVAVGARRKGTHPEAREEEVVGENGDGEDVDQLPAEEGGFEEA